MDTFKNKFRAFTLAEVLITLGIIGVVAAMTLPTLIQRQQEKATVTSLKKTYSVLSQAYTRAVDEYGPVEDWGLVGYTSPEGANSMMEKITHFLKTNKTCKAGQRGCLKDVQYLELDGTTKYSNFDIRPDISKAKLSDGTILTFFAHTNDCSGVWGSSKDLQNMCGTIAVDINGYNKPNQIGIDYFQFVITKYGITPIGSSDMTNPFKFTTACRDRHAGSITGWGPNGLGCAAWVIYNENMDYLHCDDLAWDGKTKCSK